MHLGSDLLTMLRTSSIYIEFFNNSIIIIAKRCYYNYFCWKNAFIDNFTYIIWKVLYFLKAKLFIGTRCYIAYSNNKKIMDQANKLFLKYFILKYFDIVDIKGLWKNIVQGLVKISLNTIFLNLFSSIRYNTEKRISWS